MGEKGKIKANLGNLLSYIGLLYRNPRDAIKEYISNDIDRWKETRLTDCVGSKCSVRIVLSPSHIIIRSHSQPGQDKDGLKEMMNRVADSIKPTLIVTQIGRLAIGIFAFNLFGSTATFYSKRRDNEPTWKLTLCKATDDYELETAIKRESLETPGMDIRITGLAFDPTRARSALAPQILAKYLSEYFDYYLRDGTLEIIIEAKGQIYTVAPPAINLSPIGEAFKEAYVQTSRGNQCIRTQLWFDPSMEGRIVIRNAGVVIIDDIKRVDEVELAFNRFVWSTGYVRGAIDVDFLRPLPARTGFELNEDWRSFLNWLEQIEPQVRSEVENFRLEQDIQRAEGIRNEAKQLAEELLGGEPFLQLESLTGMRKKRGEVTQHKTHPTGHETGELSSKREGDRNTIGGLSFALREKDLPGDIWRHSEFQANTLIMNTKNPHYIKYVKNGKGKDPLKYSTLLIGKETMAFNDHSHGADYYLEKLLAFSLELDQKLPS